MEFSGVEQFFQHSDIADIAEKVFAGQRLTFADGVRLYQANDLLALGVLADFANRQRNGDNIYFVQNRHINPTNICAAHCNFCSFRRNGDEDDAYMWTVEEIIERTRETVNRNTREFHIVSGLHPDLKIDYYCDLLRALKTEFPWVSLKAFTAVEIDYLARIGNMDWREVLTVLRNAGLDAMPGGGAEIFHPRVRRKICPEKIVGSGWLAIHGIAHELGLKTNATMLYGHVENTEDRVDHLIQLREQQDKSGGFMTFVPLAYHPANNNLGRARKLLSTTGFDDLRNLAVSRLMLDNFPHVKAYWVMLTPKVVQVSLAFGVSDIDGTVVEERIYHDAGARTSQVIHRDELVAMIRTAGKVPVERDALYGEVEVSS
jgi:aminodeoxyfutalosine synthase